MTMCWESVDAGPELTECLGRVLTNNDVAKISISDGEDSGDISVLCVFCLPSQESFDPMSYVRY